jgi:hypothetical protein
LSWELRVAMSLAHLWGSRRQYAEARELLGEVYARFTEGHQTVDLVKAFRLLRSMPDEPPISRWACGRAPRRVVARASPDRGILRAPGTLGIS